MTMKKRKMHPENSDELVAGDRVQCRYRGPDHTGTVLALDDIRAWAGSLAFPDKNPDQKAVTDHVKKLLARGVKLDNKVPVYWDFCVMYWDRYLTKVDDK